MPKKKASPAPAPSDFTLQPEALGKGFLVNIRMTKPEPGKVDIAYARYQPKTGEISAVSPVGHKTKKPVFANDILKSPSSGQALKYPKIEAITPDGKTKLIADAVMGEVITPKKQTQYTLIRLSSQPTAFDEQTDLALKEFNEALAHNNALLLDNKENTDLSKKPLFHPEFRGGTILLTAEDVQYRSCKNKKTGGHRSMYPAPTSVMNYQSAKECAIENGFYSKKFTRWDWGHLLPAGGSPRGAEVNLDPYNFFAVPATLNTWQMVPELIARHLAEAGFSIEYTSIGRAEKTKTGEFGFVAKEIYTSVKLAQHGIQAEFFTTRETHRVPCTTDAVHILSEFYKLAGKPFPEDLKEKFEKTCAEKIAQSIKEDPEMVFTSPEKDELIPAEKRPYMAPAEGLEESPNVCRRLGFKPINSKRVSVKFDAKEIEIELEKSEALIFSEKSKKDILPESSPDVSPEASYKSSAKKSKKLKK